MNASHIGSIFSLVTLMRIVNVPTAMVSFGIAPGSRDTSCMMGVWLAASAGAFRRWSLLTQPG
eukprot:8235589-Prorocentrum_lima.AAC.1